ncbi:MAG TPA: mechanosensitive ion channel family protein [Stenomitos sp.]
MDLSPALRNLHQMGERLIAFLPQLVVGFLVFGVAFFLAGRTRSWVRTGVNRTVKGTDLGSALGQLAFGGVLVAGAIVATAVMGVGIGSLLAGMGVTGFVIGFALKDVLENYVAGLLLLFSRPFETGDQIRSGAFYGRVRAISTRATTIETYDGQEVILPNAQLFTNPLVNETRYGRRQSVLTFKLPPARDLAGRLRGLEAKVAKVVGVLPEPAVEARTVEAAVDGVKVELRFWSPPQHAAIADTVDRVTLAVQAELYAPAPGSPE